MLNHTSVDGEAVSESRFAEIWTMHERAVHQGCLRWLGGKREDADEAYARSAMQAFQKCPPDFHDAEHAKAWLLTVARNVCMDLHRERRRDRRVIAEPEPAAAQLRIDRFPDEAHDPEVAYLSREQNRRVRAVLALLPSRLRQTAELHYLSEMRYGDIARELGISPANVRKRMQQVRALLRRPPAAAALPESLETNTPQHGEDRTLCCRQVRIAAGIERDAELTVGLRVERHDTRRIAGLHRYIEHHPGGWRKRLELARILAIDGRWNEAITHYRLAVQKHPFAEAAWTELGAALQALGRSIEASGVYEQAALAVGRDAQRLHFSGMAAASRGESTRAVELLAEALRTNAVHAASLRELGVLQLASGHPLEAAELLRRCLDADPYDPLAPGLLCNALLENGRTSAARGWVEGLLGRDPANVLALEQVIAFRAQARLVEGLEGAATDALLARLRRLAPDRAGTAIAAARLALARGRGINEGDPLSRYLRAHPRHGQAWLALGQLRVADGDARSAVSALRIASNLDPASRPIWMAFCRALRFADDAAETRGAVTFIRERFRSDAFVLAEAALLAASFDLEQGVELARVAAALQPKAARIRRSYAALLLRARRFDDALQELDAADRALPNGDAHAEAISVALLRSDVHDAMSDAARAHDAAMTAWERTDDLAANDPAATQARRGQILERLGMHREAAAAYRSALAQHVAFPLRKACEDGLARLRSTGGTAGTP